MTTFPSRTCTLIPQRSTLLGPEGARHLAGALEKLTSMQTLYLVSHVRVRVRIRDMGRGLIGLKRNRS
jgi:hypothetical protein